MNESLEPNPEEVSKTPAAGRSLFGWPAAVCVVALGLIGLAAFVFKSCANQPAHFAETVAKALQPQINVNTIIQTSLNRLRDESKLVVYTADVSVMITKYSEKKVVYGKLNLGTTTVRVRAAGNKAQIIVPLKSLATSDFRYNETDRHLTVTVPAPRVDESLVEVQTDPTFYEVQTEVGWARLNKLSGDFLREQARRDLRPAVILEANQPHVIDLAKKSAQEKIAALLEPTIKAVEPNARVSIRFKDPPPQ
jgi:hypothetical protein